MEFETNAVFITKHELSKYIQRWETNLQQLVVKFHNKSFVHGDLQDANILSGDDGHVKLDDFAWGGKDDEVSYATPKIDVRHTSQLSPTTKQTTHDNGKSMAHPNEFEIRQRCASLVLTQVIHK